MITLRVGQRVRVTKMQRARLVVNGLVVFDFDKARGNTAVIEEITSDGYVKAAVRFDAPNAGVMLISPRHLKPARQVRKPPVGGGKQSKMQISSSTGERGLSPCSPAMQGDTR